MTSTHISVAVDTAEPVQFSTCFRWRRGQDFFIWKNVKNSRFWRSLKLLFILSVIYSYIIITFYYNKYIIIIIIIIIPLYSYILIILTSILTITNR